MRALSILVGLSLIGVWAVTVWITALYITDDSLAPAVFWQMVFASAITLWLIVKALYFRSVER